MDDVIKSKVLLVDDVEINCVILAEIISSMGHEPLTATSAKEAIEIMKNDLPDLILLDISMPDMNGLEFCKLLKDDVYTREIPVIFISALDSEEDLSSAFETGAVDYILKPFEPMDVQVRVTTHLKLYHMQRELEESNRRLNAVIKNRHASDKGRQRSFMKTFGEIVMDKDRCRTHICGSEADMCRILAQAMQFTPEYEDVITDLFVENMEMAAALHDIGYIMIPDSILLKGEPFDENEKKCMQEHVFFPVFMEMYSDEDSNSHDELYIMLKNVVRSHHEHYDGSGYPDGLKGEAIPLAARIMTVIDVFDALVNDRCYQKAISPTEAVKVIEDGAGTIFDPSIVKIFSKIQRQFTGVSKEE